MFSYGVYALLGAIFGAFQFTGAVGLGSTIAVLVSIGVGVYVSRLSKGLITTLKEEKTAYFERAERFQKENADLTKELAEKVARIKELEQRPDLRKLTADLESFARTQLQALENHEHRAEQRAERLAQRADERDKEILGLVATIGHSVASLHPGTT